MKWGPRQESNLQPADYKSAALPIELHGHDKRVLVLGAGVEPACAFARWFLRPECLPIPPSEHGLLKYGYTF